MGLIVIQPFHNHSLDTAETLRYLPADESKEKFMEYFNDGMGIAESAKYHEEILRLEEKFEEKHLANGRMNPTYRTIRNWHDQWRLLHLGPRTGSDMIKVI